ncbi:UNKNOWN [Stylonychia lemnae]|uniref:Secreted protein n=1 Tax=Stylonychia lemnae TaxID=5949 RepID=A0A078ACZ1_STYLE|nr:UNKNOWN [Stylonychia lemnae]|eukprot:CDW78723.1 UNKNOWN [Stylonychia lemnae]
MLSKALLISTSIICLNSLQSVEAKSKFLGLSTQNDHLNQIQLSELDLNSQYKPDQYSFGVLSKSPSQLTAQKELNKLNKGMQQIGQVMEKYNKCEKDCRDEKCNQECTLTLMSSFNSIKDKENNQHISQSLLLKESKKKKVDEREKQDSKNDHNDSIEKSIQIEVQEQEEKNKRSIPENSQETNTKVKESHYCHEICHDNSKCVTKCLAYIDSRIEDLNDKPLLMQAIFETQTEQEKPAHDWNYYNQHPDYEAFFACRKRAQTEKQIERCFKYLGKNSWKLEKQAANPHETLSKETQQIIQ